MRWRKGRLPPILADLLTPSESIRMILKRRGKAEAGIYVDDRGEIRSPNLTPRAQDASKLPQRSR